MPHETVPADIAAAIDAYRQAVKLCARAPLMANADGEGEAYRALNAVVLKHLREGDAAKAHAANYRAALERIEQGV